MKKVYSEPKFALVEAFNPLDPEGNYFIVEEFSSAEHLGKAGISLFDEQRDVEHLRNRILN